jgi:hypothetical protein
MKHITVILDDKVGVLADISYILGAAHINIETLSVVSMEGKAILVMFVKDEKKAKELLKSNKYNVLEEEMFLIKLKDQPGELSKVTSLLSKNKVNMSQVMVVAKEKGSSIMAFKVDKPKKAKRLMGPYLKID